VDYIFDHVALHEKPLDVEGVLASRTTLYVAVMDKRTGETWMINTKETRTPLLKVLKAAAALPVFYNRTVDVDGKPCMDGGMVIPFAVRQALANGCTDVLVLATRPHSHPASSVSVFDRFVFNTLCARGNARLERLFVEKPQRSKEARDLACGRVRAPEGTRIATICAEEVEHIHWMTTDREQLRAAATSYGKKTLRIFGGDADAWSIPQDCGVRETMLTRAPLT
jgi:predicted acylesterase/phospholipase RssA